MIIARGVSRAKDKGDNCELLMLIVASDDSETGVLAFSMYASEFRILVGRMPVVLIGAGLGRFEGFTGFGGCEFDAEKATGRKK